MIRVMIIEDDEDFIYLTREMIEREIDMSVVGEGTDAQQCLKLACSERPDVVLMDLNLSGDSGGYRDGMKLSKRIKSQVETKVLLLTSYEEPETVKAAVIESFASGYLYKSKSRRLVWTIRDMLEGNTAEEIMICNGVLSILTVSEYYVLLHYLGYEVELHSSRKTMANQISSIVRKYGLERPEDLIHVFGPYPDLSKLSPL